MFLLLLLVKIFVVFLDLSVLLQLHLEGHREQRIIYASSILDNINLIIFSVVILALVLHVAMIKKYEIFA